MDTCGWCWLQEDSRVEFEAARLTFNTLPRAKGLIGQGSVNQKVQHQQKDHREEQKEGDEDTAEQPTGHIRTGQGHQKTNEQEDGHQQEQHYHSQGESKPRTSQLPAQGSCWSWPCLDQLLLLFLFLFQGYVLELLDWEMNMGYF